MHNLLIAQSGGPTSAINATLAGVVAEAMISEKVGKIIGGMNGIQGILEEKFINLGIMLTNTDDLDVLAQTPASALGSCRFKLKCSEESDTQYKRIIDIFRKHEISWFIYIGGNDSMDTVYKLSSYCEKHGIQDIHIIGAPKTIDNDLMAIDHCPGFPSAAKYIATTFSELERDVAVYDDFGVTIVEVMGRNTGWLTAASAMARANGGIGPDFIYLCEIPFDIEDFLEDIKSRRDENRNLLIAVSEGIQDKNGKYLSEQVLGNKTDVFGHKYIAGTGKILEQIVRDKFQCKVRSIELNLMQRCAAHLVSRTDLNESRLLGAKAVQSALQGQSGKMVTLYRIQNNPYEIKFSTVPINQVANKEKKIPREWISDNGNDVAQEMIYYLKPLIQGDIQVILENNLPKHIIF